MQCCLPPISYSLSFNVSVVFQSRCNCRTSWRGLRSAEIVLRFLTESMRPYFDGMFKYADEKMRSNIWYAIFFSSSMAEYTDNPCLLWTDPVVPLQLQNQNSSTRLRVPFSCLIVGPEHVMNIVPGSIVWIYTSTSVHWTAKEEYIDFIWEQPAWFFWRWKPVSLWSASFHHSGRFYFSHPEVVKMFKYERHEADAKCSSSR